MNSGPLKPESMSATGHALSCGGLEYTIVIPAKAGIHLAVDSLFRRNDENSQGFKPMALA